MATTKSTNREKFSINNLHSEVASKFARLIAITKDVWFEIEGEPCRFEAFEGYRTEERQEYLFTVTKTTKAGPGQSAHNHGLAVDFAVRVYTRDDAGKILVDGPAMWTWSGKAPWAKLKTMAKLVGLDIPIAWDLGHVQPPQWREYI